MEKPNALTIKSSAIESLPLEIKNNIFSFLSVNDLYACEDVSQTFRKLVKHFLSNLPSHPRKPLYNFVAQYSNTQTIFKQNNNFQKSFNQNISNLKSSFITALINKNYPEALHTLNLLTNFIANKLKKRKFFNQEEWERAKHPLAKAICLSQYQSDIQGQCFYIQLTSKKAATFDFLEHAKERKLANQQYHATSPAVHFMANKREREFFNDLIKLSTEFAICYLILSAHVTTNKNVADKPFDISTISNQFPDNTFNFSIALMSTYLDAESVTKQLFDDSLSITTNVAARKCLPIILLALITPKLTLKKLLTHRLISSDSNSDASMLLHALPRSGHNLYPQVKSLLASKLSTFIQSFLI